VPGQPDSLIEVITALICALEQSGIPYAFGGAVALSAWSEPRATVDVDLNVWIDEQRYGELFDTLEQAGAEVDREAGARRARAMGMIDARVAGYRLDIFVPSVQFYDEALARRQRVRIAGHDTWVLSPECLAVFKLLFFRGKDIVDLQRLVEIQGDQLDVGFVRRHVAAMMGEDDVRVDRWDEITGRKAGS
jgi:hypothetical protein